MATKLFFNKMVVSEQLLLWPNVHRSPVFVQKTILYKPQRWKYFSTYRVYNLYSVYVHCTCSYRVQVPI